ncbi:MAG: acyl-CoA dehydrogenase family protein, partial [Myxococcota bacterium]
MNFYDDNEDLQFYMERGIDWATLVELTEAGGFSEDGHASLDDAKEFFREVLTLVGEYSANEIAAHILEIDKAHPKLQDGEVVYPEAMNEALAGLRELELNGLTLPRELGGMNAPLLLFQIQTELLGRADVSIAAHHGFHGGIAMSALAYAIEEGTVTFDRETKQITETRFREVIDTFLAGEAWGSMDITEPDAGSDMAALRCRGEQDEDGNWFVTGQKIFI